MNIKMELQDILIKSSVLSYICRYVWELQNIISIEYI